MERNYIPKPGDYFEAYEVGGIYEKRFHDRKTGMKETVVINLVVGHKSCDGPFLCTVAKLNTTETKKYRFHHPWYRFKKVEPVKMKDTDNVEKNQ